MWHSTPWGEGWGLYGRRSRLSWRQPSRSPGAATELPQLPRRAPCPGLVLIIDMWSGLGGLLVAALALGLRCIAISAETDQALCDAKRRLFPNLVDIPSTELLGVGIFDKIFARRKIQAVLVGGGSPCQANSVLNTNRAGLADPTLTAAEADAAPGA